MTWSLRLALGVSLVLAAGPCRAADAFQITVTPSGLEDPKTENLDRLERMVRRFDRTERAFRHICVSCGVGAVGADGTARFDPLTTLAAKPPASPVAPATRGIPAVNDEGASEDFRPAEPAEGAAAQEAVDLRR